MNNQNDYVGMHHAPRLYSARWVKPIDWWTRKSELARRMAKTFLTKLRGSQVSEIQVIGPHRIHIISRWTRDIVYKVIQKSSYTKWAMRQFWSSFRKVQFPLSSSFSLKFTQKNLFKTNIFYSTQLLFPIYKQQYKIFLKGLDNLKLYSFSNYILVSIL